MTDEERQLIQGLTDRIRNAPAPQIDRDADNLIRQNIGQRPDSLYILTQTVLIQEMALTQAKQQIEQLKAQTPQQPPASFLPSNTPGNPGGGRSYGGQQPPPLPAGGYQGSSYRTGYQPPPPPPIPQYVEVVEQPTGGRFSGFLQNAAQTAAGVVAGEVAFSALSSIFGHHGGGGFFGGGGGYYSPGSETIINNNYYEDGPRGGDRNLDSSGLSPDLEDRRFAGDDSGNDSNTDDSNTDDSPEDDSSDDSSSYDDSGDDNSGSDDSGF